MGDFNIISFAELMQYGCAEEKPQPSSELQKTEDNHEKPNAAVVVTEGRQVINDGVFIQDINHKLWKICDWDGSVKPNAIAVISRKTNFLIALDQSESRKPLSLSHNTPLEKCMTLIESTKEAKADYSGARNTENILKVEPSNVCAAAYCDEFVFPDGKTKGYLPSFGQLYIACQNKTVIDAALNKCGGTKMRGYFASSTLWHLCSTGCRRCYMLSWDDGLLGAYRLDYHFDVRPFANFN